jgi:hypothetical protein
MRRRAPMGAKMIPMMRRVGRTVLGVRIGCQAFSRCCLKAVSKRDDEEGKGKGSKERRAYWQVASNYFSPSLAALLERTYYDERGP